MTFAASRVRGLRLSPDLAQCHLCGDPLLCSHFQVFLGSAACVSHFNAGQGQPKAALEHLEAAQKLAPEAALPKLMLATAHLSQAMTRKVQNRHFTILTAFAHLQVRVR